MAIDFSELESLPDDVEYVLPNGTKLTLGDVRAAAHEHVNKRIAELTPREQKLAAGERALAEESAQVRTAMAALAAAPPSPTVPTPGAPSPPLGYTQQQWEVIRADPYTRPLVEALSWLVTEVKETKDRVSSDYTTRQQQEEAKKQADEARWINYQFDLMANNDPRYKDPAERQALIDYAKEVLTKRDLTVLDRARHFDTRMESARKEGYEKGLKEGISKAPVPFVPSRTSPPVPTPAPEKLPSSHSQFVDDAMADPDLIQSIREAASQP